MNEIFNTGLTFWQFIGAVATLTISIVTIKVAVSFDLNKYLDRRDEKLAQKLKNTCTHMLMELVGRESGNKAQYKFQSLFESPPGTHQWQCQRCGLIRNHDNDYKSRAEYYAQNPDEYSRMHKKFQKLLEKHGIV